MLDDIAGSLLELLKTHCQAHSVDLDQTDDIFSNIAIERQYPDRFMMVMRQLTQLDNAWLDFISEEPHDGLDQTTLELYATMAKFRSTAASIWLLTMMGQAGDRGRPLGRPQAVTIWEAMSMADRSIATERARDYVGSYYNGISNNDISPGAWIRTA